MSSQVRCGLCLIAGTLAIVVLALSTVAVPPQSVHWWEVALFALLICFTMTFSVPAGGTRISLMPMAVAVAYLGHGWIVASWAVCLGILGHTVVRGWRSRHDPESTDITGVLLLEATVMNVAAHTLSLLAAATVYRRLNGVIPLIQLDIHSTSVLLAFAAIYLGVNHVLIGSYLALRGKWRKYLGSAHYIVLYEAAPMVLAPLIVTVYTRLGIGYFLVFAIAMGASSLIAHNLAVTSQRLQRRLQELSSLQAVGQALSQSLDLETVVKTVYEQVLTLMPATSFYLALYNADLDEVSFPIVIEQGQAVRSATRRARSGLTEYVLRTGTPLLLSRDVFSGAAALGLEQIGPEAASWVGIPMMAGATAVGMFAVQSYDTPGAYNDSHLGILQAIAAQAAIAIQNAHLYERTDEALARRVQELDSVLRTTEEGMLLLDREWRVLAANRALADFLHVSQADLPRHPIDTLRHNGESLVALIGTSLPRLKTDSERLRAGKAEQIVDHLVLSPSKAPVERTMTPVRNSQGAITGWLLVFRDRTKELELARLREDLTHMLVHDLRSPLTLIQGSLDLVPEALESQDIALVHRLTGMARGGSDRVLTLIDQLLDIGRLERGQIHLNRESVAPHELLDELAARYEPIAAASNIELHVDRNGGLPPLHVDRSIVTRVLSNLVDNAIKFTPDGGKVRVWAHYASPMRSIRFGVQDTGPGIPPEAQSRLFQKFQQVAGILGRRRGTGLGLSFCKLAVEAHGGEIWIESTVGQGSTFYATLPLVRDTEHALSVFPDLQILSRKS